jgi:hypothetical protein
VQPQNRFLFLYPLHIADIAIISSLTLHFFSCLTENRPFIRFGPATIIAIILFLAGILSLHIGVYQTTAAWNSYIDRLAKGVLVVIMLEAMADTSERVWAVMATIMFATLWWIKAGLRLSLSGMTFAGDRVMGPGVSIVDNPNGFAYMLCVMLPIYLYFFQQSRHQYLRLGFLFIVLSCIYIIMQTGSRTGMIILLAVVPFLLPKYGRDHKFALLVSGISIFLIIGIVSPGNIQRFKTIPKSIAAALSGETKDPSALDQDEQSAQERRLKNEQTWALIKEYPLFGVGINPDENMYIDRFPYAAGQVHCEILMAGRQMGLMGMSLYAGLLGIIFFNGWRIQKVMYTFSKGYSDLGWTLKIQAVAIAVGGAFSPLPWNVVTLLLAGAASALWINLQEQHPVWAT